MGIWITIHLLGVVLFIGNASTAAYWKITAVRSGDVRLLAHTVRRVMTADYVFTIPGLALVVASGSVLAVQEGYALDQLSWLTVSLLLFIATGLLWVSVLMPCQRAMIRESDDSIAQGRPNAAFRRASLRWDVFGILATVLPLAVMYLMVAKPF
ncbi:DUF2269 domain-containing protein [Paenibacillus sp. IB182496]|uniref:DUF2269 domain-containing protein n=1 Tax=Paenibacillus sabuli TaxID=2772509 RepID=A0A927BVR9_9BACL|nr:DUF2269 domain-containing protein [Paenibacillus sabuli]